MGLTKRIGLRLFKSDLEKLILKKSAILLIILAIIFSVFFNSRLYLIAGLTVGGIFGLIRLNSLTAVLSGMLSVNNTRNTTIKSITGFLITQMFAAVLLLGSAMLNIWIFVGLTAGILLVPTTIFINAITESFGITHNNFE